MTEIDHRILIGLLACVSIGVVVLYIFVAQRWLGVACLDVRIGGVANPAGLEPATIVFALARARQQS